MKGRTPWLPSSPHPPVLPPPLLVLETESSVHGCTTIHRHRHRHTDTDTHTCMGLHVRVGSGKVMRPGTPQRQGDKPMQDSEEIMGRRQPFKDNKYHAPPIPHLD